MSSQLTRRALLAGAAGAAAGGLLSHAAAAEPPVVPAAVPLPRPPATVPADRIWDCHAHFSGYTGPVRQRVDQMLAAADRVGIERITLFMGLSFVADPRRMKYAARTTTCCGPWPTGPTGSSVLST